MSVNKHRAAASAPARDPPARRRTRLPRETRATERPYRASRRSFPGMKPTPLQPGPGRTRPTGPALVINVQGNYAYQSEPKRPLKKTTEPRTRSQKQARATACDDNAKVDRRPVPANRSPLGRRRAKDHLPTPQIERGHAELSSRITERVFHTPRPRVRAGRAAPWTTRPMAKSSKSSSGKQKRDTRKASETTQAVPRKVDAYPLPMTGSASARRAYKDAGPRKPGTGPAPRPR